MPEPMVYLFSQHIGNLCVSHDTNVHKLGAKLGIDPAELVRAFNGPAPASKTVVAGLAKALDTDVRVSGPVG
jgi:hypothetical protein